MKLRADCLYRAKAKIYMAGYGCIYGGIGVKNQPRTKPADPAKEGGQVGSNGMDILETG